jgi:2-hydroxy-3-keto-5-methylthiopentenyl-1-phosphate phosphatase
MPLPPSDSLTSDAPALVIDFDGTIALADVGDAICDHFAPPAWRDIDQAWLRGELSLPEAQRRMWALARATQEQMETYAHTVGALRPGLSDLLDAARARGYRVLLASGGFDFYIRPLLGPLAGSFDQLICNGASFDGDRISLAFYEGLACSSCAVCKGRVCERELTRGARRVVFVGDGSSDRCVLACASLAQRKPPADAIAAVRGARLEQACLAAAVPHLAFDDLADLVDLL